jgi:hypothetical protein
MEQKLKLSKCIATGKTRFTDPGQAKTAIQKLKAKKTAYNSITLKRIKRRNGKIEQCRYYYCSHCKGWHLTSNDAKLNTKGIEKRFYDRISKQANLILTQDQAGDWKADSLPFPESIKTNI